MIYPLVLTKVNPAGNEVGPILYVYGGTPPLALIGLVGRFVVAPITNGTEFEFFVSVIELGGGDIIFNWNVPVDFCLARSEIVIEYCVFVAVTVGDPDIKPVLVLNANP